MKETIASSFDVLEKLSDRDLHRSAERLVVSEKRNVANLIAHLSEISKRKSCLKQGSESLFDYCVRCLHLSEGSTYLRIQVANVCRRFPQILDHLAANRISLTVAGLLSPHLREENVEKLLSESEGKTKRQVEEYLVGLKPKPTLEPKIRKKPAPRQAEPESPAPSSEGAGGAGVEASPPESPLFPEPQPTKPPVRAVPSGAEARGKLEPAEPDVFNFRFSAERGFKEKLERLGEVLGVKATEKRMAEILERALDLALEQKDPQRRLERRKKRDARVAQDSSPDEASAPKERTEASAVGGAQEKRSRHVPVAFKDRALERARYQCEYRGPDGARCTQRVGLEIDHRRPFGKRGVHDEENIVAQAEKDLGGARARASTGT
jgi:hypothetical protein